MPTIDPKDVPSNADKFVSDTWTIVTTPTKKTPKEPVKKLRVYWLGGAGSGNFGHGGRPGEVGGSSSEGGGAAKAQQEYTKRKEAENAAFERYFDAKDTMKAIRERLVAEKGEDVEWWLDPDYEKAGDVARFAAQERHRAELAVKEYEPVVRKAIVTDHAHTVSERMGYDPKQIDVVDKEPSQFTVAGRQLSEGGHYDPSTGRIEVNARNIHDNPEFTRELVAHEIRHAQDDAVFKAAQKEHGDIQRTMLKGQRVVGGPGEVFQKADPEYDRLFTKAGFPKTSRIAEIEARWPASAALAKTAPQGDSYLGTWSKGEDGKWAFDEKAYGSMNTPGRAEAMEKDDGFTAYSKLYWEALNTEKGTAGEGLARRRAEQETLAEVAAYHERAPRGRWAQGVPSKSWQAYGRTVQDAFETLAEKS